MSSQLSLSAIGFASMMPLLFGTGCAASARKPAGPAGVDSAPAFPVEPPAWAGMGTSQDGAPAAPARDRSQPVVLLGFKHVAADEGALLGSLTAPKPGEARVVDKPVVEGLSGLAGVPATRRLPNIALLPDQPAWVAVTQRSRVGQQIAALGDRVFAQVSDVTADAASVRFEWQNAAERGTPGALATWRVAGTGRMRPGQALLQRVVQGNGEVTHVIAELIRIAQPDQN